MKECSPGSWGPRPLPSGPWANAVKVEGHSPVPSIWLPLLGPASTAMTSVSSKGVSIVLIQRGGLWGGKTSASSGADLRPDVTYPINPSLHTSAKLHLRTHQVGETNVFSSGSCHQHAKSETMHSRTCSSTTLDYIHGDLANMATIQGEDLGLYPR